MPKVVTERNEKKETVGLVKEIVPNKTRSQPILVLDPPDLEDKGKYILAVYKETGKFGSTIMFSIDELRLVVGTTKVGVEVPWYYQGYYINKKGFSCLRVQFPAHNDYMLVERAKVRALSKEEFREERKQELIELRESVEDFHPGNILRQAECQHAPEKAAFEPPGYL